MADNWWDDPNRNPLMAAWMSLPPEARDSYKSAVGLLGELSPGAAVRDAVDSSGEIMGGLLSGDLGKAGSGAAGMALAAAGLIPGGRAARIASKEAAPIRAYHGSPHDFDRFDMSKIGTGEGAQAYGHGLYFAENEGVAKGYRDALTKSGQEWGARTLDKAGGDVDAAIAAIQGKIDRYKAGGADSYAAGQEEILRALQQYKQTGAWSSGKMYEVNIHADPEKFLDWDKPIVEQDAQVQRAANALLDPGWNKGDWNPTGGMLVGPHRGVEAERRTQILKDAGIPGVKYLDGGSRSAGDGSRNYVAFDDKIIEILRKYGILAPVAGAGAVGAATVPGLLDTQEAY